MAVEPQRLAIKKQITSLLEGINPTNTDPATGLAYTSDLRDKVFRGRSVVGVETSRPFVAILEAPTNDPGFRAAHQDILSHGGWALLIQLFAENASDHETDNVDWLMAQVEQRLSRIVEVISEPGMNKGKGKHAEYLLGGLVSGATLAQGVVRPADQQVSATAYGYLVLTVKLKTNPANPYVST
jgi:hypothetical protein